MPVDPNVSIFKLDALNSNQKIALKLDLDNVLPVKEFEFEFDLEASNIFEPNDI